MKSIAPELVTESAHRLRADRFGAKPVLVVGLVVQGLAAAAYLQANQLTGFYVVAIVFGMAYGGTMPLYASLAREAFGPRILGSVLGAAGIGLMLSGSDNPDAEMENKRIQLQKLINDGALTSKEAADL